MKINSNLSIPQIIFDETLALNYPQFITLAEMNLIDKISLGKICSHFRFFGEQVIYPNLSFIKNEENKFLNFFNKINKNECIYCYSNKKCKKKINFFCNFRNSNDEETNNILEYCENSNYTINLFDSENLNGFTNKNFTEKQKNFFLLNSNKNNNIKLLLIEDQIIPYEHFIEKIQMFENENIKFSECFLCNRKILIEGKKNIENFFLKKCEYCVNEKINHQQSEDNGIFTGGKEEALNNYNLLKNKLNTKKEKKNYFNFIEKLKLRELNENFRVEKIFFENEEKLKKNNTNISDISSTRDTNESTLIKSLSNELSFFEI